MIFDIIGQCAKTDYVLVVFNGFFGWTRLVELRFWRDAAQRATIVKKVHKPPLKVNVISFELSGFNVFSWVPESLSELKRL